MYAKQHRARPESQHVYPKQNQKMPVISIRHEPEEMHSGAIFGLILIREDPGYSQTGGMLRVLPILRQQAVVYDTGKLRTATPGSKLL